MRLGRAPVQFRVESGRVGGGKEGGDGKSLGSVPVGGPVGVERFFPFRRFFRIFTVKSGV